MDGSQNEYVEDLSRFHVSVRVRRPITLNEVAIQKTNTKRLMWDMGILVGLLPGHDGRIHVALVRTKWNHHLGNPIPLPVGNPWNTIPIDNAGEVSGSGDLPPGTRTNRGGDVSRSIACITQPGSGALDGFGLRCRRWWEFIVKADRDYKNWQLVLARATSRWTIGLPFQTQPIPFFSCMVHSNVRLHHHIISSSHQVGKYKDLNPPFVSLHSLSSKSEEMIQCSKP